jgi:VanZ family protein
MRTGFGRLWLAYALFVVYGSLVPFDFRARELSAAFQTFLHTPYLALGVGSRADWVANGVLYVPLGLLGARVLGAGRPGLIAATLSWLLAAALAVAVEFTQLFFPPRTVSQNDLMAECLGALLGVAVAPYLGAWVERWRAAWSIDGARLVAAALPAYAVAYVLYGYFPFDLLLSRAEMAHKLASDNWAWFVARPADGSLLRTLLSSVAEVVLTLPIGAWLARRAGGRLSTPGAMLFGAVLGLLIEGGQLLIASGVSQGLSVLTRVAGVALGAAIGTRWKPGSLAAVRVWLGLHGALLTLPYLVLLVLASGWGRHPWGGETQAAVAWEQLHFMPLYYHYYTTEAVALSSLTTVALMYLPLGVLAWARHAGVWPAALLAGCLALLIESGKLFLVGTHPDPTNVLIAATVVGLVVRYLPYLNLRAATASVDPSSRTLRAEARVTPRVEARVASNVEARAPSSAELHATSSAGLRATTAALPAQVVSADPVRPLSRAWMLLVLPLIAWAAWLWPAGQLLVVLVLAVAAGLTWFRPGWALALVPLALPVFDLAPWSGLRFVDEFTLLSAACLAVAFFRTPAAPHRRAVDGVSLAFALFGLSLAVSTVRGLDGAWPVDANSFSHYYSGFNALRISQGACLAWLYVRLFDRRVAVQPGDAALFNIGMVAGLALTVAVVLWERLAFVGLFDFTADYRVTGPFSAMHKGGAYIECYLAVAAACCMALALGSRHARVWAPCAVLLVLTAYAEFVTYSRNGYAAFAWVMLVGLMAGIHRAGRRPWAVLGVSATALLVAAVAVAVLGGSFARERLAQTQQDLATRVAHWQTALSMRDDDWATTLLGVGVGRFPEAHAWRPHSEARAAGFRIEPGDNNPFLRLGAGAPVYIEQIVAPTPGSKMTLTVNLRSAGPAVPLLTVSLCRKWMLTSIDCEQASVKGISAPGIWQTQAVAFTAPPAADSVWTAWVPLKLALHSPGAGAAIDVDNVSLRQADGRELLQQGSFARGMDRWFFTTDVDPPWHIHSLPAALLFDQGWLGLLTATLLVLTVLPPGWRAARQGNAVGLAAATGLIAILISGSLNTLIDAPRFLWLLLVLAWICARAIHPPRLLPPSRRRSRRSATHEHRGHRGRGDEPGRSAGPVSTPTQSLQP